MATWKRLPQECSGDYFFSGQAYMTRGVQDGLPVESEQEWALRARTTPFQKE